MFIFKMKITQNTKRLDKRTSAKYRVYVVTREKSDRRENSCNQSVIHAKRLHMFTIYPNF